MLNVLVPVDGSDASTRALQAAVDILEGKPEATLHVLAVPTPIVSGNVKRFFSEDVLQAYYQDEGSNALLPARAVLADSPLKIKESIIAGNAAQTIKDYVEKNNVDHIVMGTRGLSALPGLVLGSVTTKVLSLVKVPVTLIK
ncbi:universal stress protein [Providencia rettgeri]|uniref:Universal stress protein n=1 Tax=Alcaligenes parafaecalis TaxID=171260 RepID=A0ABT3VIE5_9BURK|nr:MULTISPECIES: universal stress protein [Alcaligenes]MBY6346129.1 universal stress protein [Providencia rettgeri]MCX5463281.1 universal stress protein [Alcaligenes parafaecalis]QTC00715.1 universal stress protein [Alcaligenes sp. SORT26]